MSCFILDTNSFDKDDMIRGLFPLLSILLFMTISKIFTV